MQSQLNAIVCLHDRPSGDVVLYAWGNRCFQLEPHSFNGSYEGNSGATPQAGQRAQFRNSFRQYVPRSEYGGIAFHDSGYGRLEYSEH